MNRKFFLFFLFGFSFLTDTSAQETDQNNSFELDQKILGEWTNDAHFLHIHNEENVFLEVNRSCGVELPIRVLSPQSFEIIWIPEIDCVFDLGVLKDFNLHDYPKIGKPFAKYILKDDTIVVHYYPEWVEKFSEQEVSELFAVQYSRLD